LIVLAYALASRVEFEIGGGSAVPTQLVFVPMLFLLPPNLVPLFVAAGFALGNAIDHTRGSRHFQRVLPLLASSMHSLGPALVFSIAGEPPPSWAAAPILAVAMAAQFGLDFATSIVHESMRNDVRPDLQLRFMGTVYAVDAALAPLGLAVAAANDELPFAFLLILPLVVLLGVFARERSQRIDQALELSGAYRGTAFLLGDVVEADDAYTGSHSRDVVELTLATADRLVLDAAERRRAEFTALLHDVGKIRIPNEILNKPGPLTPEERALMETHAVEGEQLLERVGGLLGDVGHIVRSCHERWDGKGYPDGLLADEIPRIARIVACCDAYNAMVTMRPYCAARTPEQAVAELRAHAGTQFDPAVVAALIDVIGRSSAAAPPVAALRVAAR
jgi:HD-GYP domain-containing protein (c-di-GMP phosphodiesterase class II)